MLQTVEIYREEGKRKNSRYRAVFGQQQAEGKTAGQALDSLEKTLSDADDPVHSLIILQRFQPDAFFTEEQQTRVQELMALFHETMANEGNLTAEERAELEQLVDKEYIAAIARSAAILAQVSQPGRP